MNDNSNTGSGSNTFGDGLDPYDETLAPLKRNHACLQCKKRKVKCDALKPTCSPCLRSHAHALRSSQRHATVPPQLCCTYTDADGDDSDGSPEKDDEIIVQQRAEQGLPGPQQQQPIASVPGPSRISPPQTTKSLDAARKKASAKKVLPNIKSAPSANHAREKDKRMEEERETLLARIAELENKLSEQTPSTTSLSSDANNGGGYFAAHQTVSSDNVKVAPTTFSSMPETYGNNDINSRLTSAMPAPEFGNVDKTGSAMPAPGLDANSGAGAMDLDWDLGGLFMIPANWPKNLPSPFLLEHLIETFYASVPQLPRMLHRATLLYRSRLPPTHPNFPHPSLLHAICAVASSHTAWVNSLRPEVLEESTRITIELGRSLEEMEDFGLSQAYAGRRAMDQTAASCTMGSGQMLFELVQASILLGEVFFQKGMPLQGWLMAGIAPRLIKSLELGNRNTPKRYKEAMFPPPANAIEREERLATVWMAHIQDAGFAINSYWSQSMDLSEMRCDFPTSAQEFRMKTPEVMLANHQTAHTANVLSEHPVADTFVLVVKASIIMSRGARWLRDWHQREIQPGDDLAGLDWPSFKSLVSDIHAFQKSIPAATKHVLRMMDHQAGSGFDANLLLVHVLPNIALCLIQEPFVDWDNPSGPALQQIQRSYEAVVGMLHLIPSNMDVSLIMTPLMAFSLYTVGRIIANFVQKAEEMQTLGLAARYRADLSAVSSMLLRYGDRHFLGGAMSNFLDTYMETADHETGYNREPKKPVHPSAACMDPRAALSFPVAEVASKASATGAFAIPTVPSVAGSSIDSPFNLDFLSNPIPTPPHGSERLYSSGSGSVSELEFCPPGRSVSGTTPGISPSDTSSSIGGGSGSGQYSGQRRSSSQFATTTSQHSGHTQQDVFQGVFRSQTTTQVAGMGSGGSGIPVDAYASVDFASVNFLGSMGGAPTDTFPPTRHIQQATSATKPDQEITNPVSVSRNNYGRVVDLGMPPYMEGIVPSGLRVGDNGEWEFAS